jgi:hypothetical protein
MAPNQPKRNIFFIRTESTWQRDQKLLSSHPVYHVGRFFSIIGSGVIAFGLLCKFIFAEEAKSTIPIITITVSSVGCAIFALGVVFLAIAAYRTQMAVLRHKKEEKNRTNPRGQQNSNDEIIDEIVTSQQNSNPSPNSTISNGVTFTIN